MAAAVPFALAPALANDGILDYTTAEGAKLYRAAIEALPGDPFNCEPHGIKVFLATLEDRASRTGWNNILMIPQDADEPDQELTSLLHNYGRLTLQQVRDHATTYIDQEVRMAQDSAQLYHCLMNSLTKEARAKVMIWRRDYTILGFTSGPALLKVIIRESHVDTRSTILHVREKLSSLDSYISTISYDITKFNSYIKDLVDSLTTRGQVTQDLFAFILKAYKKVPDKDFNDYIRMKQNEYEEGLEEDLDPDILMTQAGNKYKSLLQAGTWNAPSPELQKIMALEAKIQQLQKKKGDNNNNVKKKGKDNDKDKDSKKKTKKKGERGKRTYAAWMLQEPKDKSKPKKVHNKDWWWCPNHKRYALHKPEDCRGTGEEQPPKPPGNSGTEQQGAQQPKLRVKQALEAIQDKSDSE
jgi:hypothetical protein